MYDNDYEVATQSQAPVPTKALSASATIMESKAMQEARTEIQMAKMFPRDMAEVNTLVTQEFENFALANKAMYKFPRGGKDITGLSIRAAEALARSYGNMNFGFKILEQDEESTNVVAFSWDKQRNVRVEREMRIQHFIKKKDGSTLKKEDPRDLLEHVNSWAQRGVRSTILEIVPKGLQDRAESIIKGTLERGPANIPHAEQINHLVVAFSKVGVPKEYIEKYLSHPVAAMTPQEKVDLIGIYNSIRDRQAKVSDFFGENEAKVIDPEDVKKSHELYDQIVSFSEEYCKGKSATDKISFLKSKVGVSRLDELKGKKSDVLQAILEELQRIPPVENAETVFERLQQANKK